MPSAGNRKPSSAPEGAVDVELAHDRLDAVDGRLLALLEQPGHLLAAQVDQAADGVVADRRQVRGRARGHAAGDRAAVDDNHLLPGGSEFVGDGQAGDPDPTMTVSAVSAPLAADASGRTSTRIQSDRVASSRAFTAFSSSGCSATSSSDRRLPLPT